jgi:hypothetical protein
VYPILPRVEHWRLLTPTNIRVRQLWGWGHSIQKIVAAAGPIRVQGNRLLIASDYGGEHRDATHLIYCYLVVGGGARSWFSTIRSLRTNLLPDGRRMSYKRLADPLRQRALVPFLRAAADLDGHLVAVAVDKRKKWLSTAPDVAQDLQRAFGLKASWNPRSLETMMRKVHFLSILLSLWSRPHMDLSWITDQDEFVANDARHDDALITAARVSSFYVPHPMGIFRLNTTGQDPETPDYEDLCAVPDLAAGMLSEIASRLSKEGSWEKGMQKTLEEQLPIKTNVIADWFWDMDMRLRKTLITIDMEGTRFSVRRVSQLQELPSCGQ